MMRGSTRGQAHENWRLPWSDDILDEPYEEDVKLSKEFFPKKNRSQETVMTKDASRKRLSLRVMLLSLRYVWPVFILLGILWFPFDWLSEVWPTFGISFRQVFHTAHDHFIGHTVFFFLIGILIICCLPALRKRIHWYILGLILAALIQETIQAYFRGELPTFTDFNAFQGDALGGMAAWVLCFVLLYLYAYRKR